MTEEEFYRFIMKMEEEVWGEYDKSLLKTNRRSSL